MSRKTYSAWHSVVILWDERSLAEIFVYVQVARMTETLQDLEVIYFAKYLILNIEMVAMLSWAIF